MEIVHVRFGIIFFFRIDPFPKRITISHEIKGIAFIKDAVRIAVINCYGQFEELVRATELGSWPRARTLNV